MGDNAPYIVFYVLAAVFVASGLIGRRVPLGNAAKMALAWIGVGSTRRSLASARNKGSVRPRLAKVFNGTKSMLRRPPMHDVVVEKRAP